LSEEADAIEEVGECVACLAEFVAEGVLADAGDARGFGEGLAFAIDEGEDGLLLLSERGEC
jgi:hypothetical protein